MTLTHTRTFVRYFGEDQVVTVTDALKGLATDWEKRRMHVGYDTRVDGDERLDMAILAIKRLGDRVPE